jgi:hypothetical protein
MRSYGPRAEFLYIFGSRQSDKLRIGYKMEINSNKTFEMEQKPSFDRKLVGNGTPIHELLKKRWSPVSIRCSNATAFIQPGKI